MVKPIRRDQSMGQKVAAQLRESILLGDFEPDAHLAEESLAAEFEVSRGPVREALRLLEIEGLVETRVNRVYVREFVERDIVDLYHLRAALEPLAVRNLAERRDEIDWEGIERSLAALQSAARAQDVAAFSTADRALHDSLIRAAGNHQLARVWDQLKPTIDVLIRITLSQTLDLEVAHSDHLALVDAIRRGEGDEAAANVERHILGSLNRMIIAHHQATSARAHSTSPRVQDSETA